jgi:undecaprenyl diphosphate synthase
MAEPAKEPVADSLPKHIGFILDGNRRWAKEQGIPTLQGHRKGLDNFKDISIAAVHMGVRYVSAFMFSTENWNRAKTEVDYLMRLLIRFATSYVDELLENDIKVVHVGSREGLPPAVVRAIDGAAAKTAHCKKAVLALCINYGGQQEIVDATKKLLRERVDPVRLTTKDFAKQLYQPDLPELDLIVRTSGEYRLSGFMLWRASYAELMFVDKHWPAFTKQDLEIVLSQYAGRQRRFGK